MARLRPETVRRRESGILECTWGLAPGGALCSVLDLTRAPRVVQKPCMRAGAHIFWMHTDARLMQHPPFAMLSPSPPLASHTAHKSDLGKPACGGVCLLIFYSLFCSLLTPKCLYQELGWN